MLTVCMVYLFLFYLYLYIQSASLVAITYWVVLFYPTRKCLSFDWSLVHWHLMKLSIRLDFIYLLAICFSLALSVFLSLCCLFPAFIWANWIFLVFSPLASQIYSFYFKCLVVAPRPTIRILNKVCLDSLLYSFKLHTSYLTFALLISSFLLYTWYFSLPILLFPNVINLHQYNSIHHPPLFFVLLLPYLLLLQML